MERYATTQDADAFAAIVRAYSGMVYGTALRIVGNEVDAEDVAQECFLELARQAGSIERSLSGWLHSVTTHRSVKWVRGERRRRERESSVMDNTGDSSGQPTWTELGPHVDEALDELPEDLQTPLIQHYLEGNAQDEVAAKLGIAQSEVSRRLKKGVNALRKALEERGVICAIAALTALLTQNAASAAPPTLAASLGKLAVAGVRPESVAATGGLTDAGSVGTATIETVATGRTASKAAAATGAIGIKWVATAAAAAVVLAVAGVAAKNALFKKEKRVGVDIAASRAAEQAPLLKSLSPANSGEGTQAGRGGARKTVAPPEVSQESTVTKDGLQLRIRPAQDKRAPEWPIKVDFEFKNVSGGKLYLHDVDHGRFQLEHCRFSLIGAGGERFVYRPTDLAATSDGGPTVELSANEVYQREVTLELGDFVSAGGDKKQPGEGIYEFVVDMKLEDYEDLRGRDGWNVWEGAIQVRSKKLRIEAEQPFF